MVFHIFTTLLCLIVGKNPHVHLINRRAKNLFKKSLEELKILPPPSPSILRNLDDFPPGVFYLIPLQFGTKKYTSSFGKVHFKITLLGSPEIIFCRIFSQGSFKK